MKQSLVFFGNERLATGVSTTAPILQGLIDAGFAIKAVIASHQDATSRQKRDLEIARLAQTHKIPLLLPSKADLLDTVKHYPADIGVLVAFGQIVPQAVIDFFPRGIVNIHPSLLPRLRGATPVESAILDGLSETGVSLMQLASEMDAGPVYAQAKLKLSGRESKQELADKLLVAGRDLLIANFAAILSAQLQPSPQDHSLATFTKKITKADGLLNFSKPADQLEREIRAYGGWPQSHAKIRGIEVIITQAHAVTSLSDGNKPGDVEVLSDIGLLMLYGADGYICVDKLKPIGKSEMTAAQFIRGYIKS